LLSSISTVKLSHWARKHGMGYLTAWRWFKAGKLPVFARQLPSGTILVEEPSPGGRTVLYARVSCPDQKADLGRIVVEHRDRLARFGFEMVEAALYASGKRIVVVAAHLGEGGPKAEGEVKDDLVRDLLEILTSACGRLYGRRSARNRAKRALEVMGCG
jgi:predicted site-specific integrase-resolvase